MLRLWLVFVVVVITGCSALPQVPTFGRAPTAPPVELSTLAVATNTPTPEPVNCAFVWSTRSLPEVTRQVTVALREHAMPEVEVEASAFGEDCIDPATNEVMRFTAMQTDFFFAVVVADSTDRDQLGSWIERIYRVLDVFPVGGELPGPNPGFVGITFSDGGDPVHLWFRRPQGEQALAEGLRGSELYDLLRTLQ